MYRLLDLETIFFKNPVRHLCLCPWWKPPDVLNFASPRRGENKFVYSVKNTFLHVEDSEEDQAVQAKEDG